MGGIIRQYSWVIDLVGILLCSFFLAKITGVYLGGALEIKRSIGILAPIAEAPLIERERASINSYRIITERNIFDATERKAEAKAGDDQGIVEEEPSPTGVAVPTSLKLTVLGVLVVGEGTDTRSSATIASGSPSSSSSSSRRKKRKSSSRANVFSVGAVESFAPDTKIVRVQPDRIEFLNKGRLEYAEVASEFGSNIFGPPGEGEVAASTPSKPSGDKDTLIRKEGGGKFTIDQAEIDNALQNLDKLYTDIRAVPNFSGGKVSGMKILSVKRGSMFSKLGLRRGDVLKRINGMELDVKRGFEIFNTLKDEKSITLDLVRQGQATTLDYEIR
jgi:type II secretion system protein C